MAFIESTTDQRIPVIYNVTHAVGADAPNKSDDVQLVQALLLMVYTNQSGVRMPQGNLTVDGFCGPITKNWILKFQLDLRGAGLSVVADRRVDRVRDKKLTGSLTNSVYTLIWLNYYARAFDPMGYADLPNQLSMTPTAMVPPPSTDYVPDYKPQQTSPR